MTKTYLISEEVLQEVLNAIDSCTACFIENDISWNGTVDDATNALRTILASPPAEQVAWYDLHINIVDMDKKFDDDIPLYRKDL